MTPEDIVRMVETDMKEGGLAYQPVYWQTKLLLRIKALVENERAKAQKEQKPAAQDGVGVGPVGPEVRGLRSGQGTDPVPLPDQSPGPARGPQGA